MESRDKRLEHPRSGCLRHHPCCRGRAERKTQNKKMPLLFFAPRSVQTQARICPCNLCSFSRNKRIFEHFRARTSRYLLRVETSQVGWNDNPVGEDVVHHLDRPHGPGESHVAHGDRSGAQGKDIRALRRTGVAAEVDQDANPSVSKWGGGGITERVRSAVASRVRWSQQITADGSSSATTKQHLTRQA